MPDQTYAFRYIGPPGTGVPGLPTRGTFAVDTDLAAVLKQSPYFEAVEGEPDPNVSVATNAAEMAGVLHYEQPEPHITPDMAETPSAGGLPIEAYHAAERWRAEQAKEAERTAARTRSKDRGTAVAEHAAPETDATTDAERAERKKGR